MKKKDVIVYVLAVTLSVVGLFVGNRVAMRGVPGFLDDSDGDILKVKVLEIADDGAEDIPDIQEDDDKGYYFTETSIPFKAKVLSGERRGELIDAVQRIDSFLVIQMREIRVGDKLTVYSNLMGGSEHEWVAGEFIRSDAMLVLGIVFSLFLLVFGRIKGLNTIISMFFTCASIFVVFIPSVLGGENIYLWSIMTCMYIIFSTVLIVYGLDKKSIAAASGCLGGTLLAGILTLIVSRLVELTGLVDEESIYLLYVNTENPINLKAIVFAAIIIGALGAILDVSVSISSALSELYDSVENITSKQLIKSGMNIGRDMMGTMTNTLVLAYIGSSLSVVLLLTAYNSSLLDLMNREMIIIEIMQALIGSFGLLLTMPLTTFICVWLYKGRHRNMKRSEKPWR